jgi:hypothetical protein
MIEKTMITTGPGTPLDGLQVDRVDLTTRFNGKTPTSSPYIDIKYKDGGTISYSGGRYVQEIKSDDGKGNTQTILVDDSTGDTSVEKSDGSKTVYPKFGNTYVVYPKAADGTQKTVTMTSQGPITTVRDADNNIRPPKE